MYPCSVNSDFRLLLTGHDTVECAYFLQPMPGCVIDFHQLGAEKEALRQAKARGPKVISLAGVEFLFQPYGTQSGYPFVMENGKFSIAFGEFNNPSFFVTFSSVALWRFRAPALHRQFLDWAAAAGLMPFRPEVLSRVDFTFDYFLSTVDFDEDCFVSLTRKDAQHRNHQKVETFQFGKGVLLRVYNKVAEIEEKCQKTWFYDLWGMSESVWRIEWQARKALLRRFGIRTFDDLEAGQGDLLRYLAYEHTTLRVRGTDSNRSRWELHPWWVDFQKQIEKLHCQGVYREIDEKAILEERLLRIAISTYGYLKRVAAIRSLQEGQPSMTVKEAFGQLGRLMRRVHDPLTWDTDVRKRMDEMRLGK